MRFNNRRRAVKQFTLVELLVVIVIIGILTMMVFRVGGWSFYKDPETGGSYYHVEKDIRGRCVRTYVYTTGSEESTSTSKRVVLQPVNEAGESVGSNLTVECNDNWYAGIHNSGSLYDQFEDGGFYNVRTIGFRREGMISFFPLVKSVSSFQPVESKDAL